MLLDLGIFFLTIVLERLYMGLCGIWSRSHIQKCEKYTVANLFTLGNEKLQSRMISRILKY